MPSPHGYYINVSLLGLPAYIEDDDIIQALCQFGDIKGKMICLKYKSDHDLTGLENGNCLVKMVLSKPAISYSLRISGRWCRVIHNNQQHVCSNCYAVDHSRRNCPEITCKYCHEKGHLSYNCPLRANAQDNNTKDNTAETTPSNEADNLPEHMETDTASRTKPSTDTMPTEVEESPSAEPGNAPTDTPPKDPSIANPEVSPSCLPKTKQNQTAA